jgi:hypothetical protein
VLGGSQIEGVYAKQLFGEWLRLLIMQRPLQ